MSVAEMAAYKAQLKKAQSMSVSEIANFFPPTQSVEMLQPMQGPKVTAPATKKQSTPNVAQNEIKTLPGGLCLVKPLGEIPIVPAKISRMVEQQITRVDGNK